MDLRATTSRPQATSESRSANSKGHSAKPSDAYNPAIALIPENAKSQRLVLLSGAEEVLRLRALREILEGIEGDPFDTHSIIASEGNAMEWIGEASTAPFLSERRTVVVRNLLRAGHPKEAFEGKDKASSPLRLLPESARMILVADDEAASDSQRVQRLESYRKAWEAEVKGAAGVVLDFAAEAGDIKRALIRAAEERDKKLGPRAADLLVEMTGRSLSRALGELDKVALYVGSSEAIQERDVAEAAIPSREWNVFKLVDYVVEGNVGAALSELRNLIQSGTKAESAALANILPNLSRTFRLLWQARVLLDNGSSPSSIPASVKALLPEPGIAEAAEWQQKRAMGAARRLELRQIGECLEAVARCDARLKGIETGFTPSDSLERMVLEMAEGVRSRKGSARA
jgi:DNA polymerase-3 subunit delta